MNVALLIRNTLVTGLPAVPLTMGVYVVFRLREDFDLTRMSDSSWNFVTGLHVNMTVRQ